MNRPPSESVPHLLEELNRSLCAEFLLITCAYWVTNIDFLKARKSHGCDYLNCIFNYGLENVIQVPTKEEIFKDTFVSSWIDHINVRAPAAVI